MFRGRGRPPAGTRYLVRGQLSIEGRGSPPNTLEHRYIRICCERPAATQSADGGVAYLGALPAEPLRRRAISLSLVARGWRASTAPVQDNDCGALGHLRPSLFAKTSEDGLLEVTSQVFCEAFNAFHHNQKVIVGERCYGNGVFAFEEESLHTL